MTVLDRLTHMLDGKSFTDNNEEEKKEWANFYLRVMEIEALEAIAFHLGNLNNLYRMVHKLNSSAEQILKERQP